MQSYPVDVEMNRALREIIISIVEANILESKNIVLNHQLVEKVFTTFQRRVYFSNGIHVEIKEEQITIRLSVNVSMQYRIMNELQFLQKRIFDDVYQLTGFRVNAINILLKNIKVEEK